ncbi:unnamed protein product [Brachionus calyciflorus]|uniref:Uncharacterized protein n=1 Tax=Brachionus calyciflorus TaxID=104777 RepID=A0A813WL70_9BILA|nr:unnamed protein product [Brachionus calyciflorus]
MQNRPFTTNFRHSIEKSTLSSSSTSSNNTDSTSYQSRIGSNKKLNISKTYLNSSKNFQELYNTDKLGLSLTNSAHKTKQTTPQQTKPDMSKQNIKTYLKKHLEKTDLQPNRIKNSNFSSFKLKNSTDFLNTNKLKLSASTSQTPRDDTTTTSRPVSSLKFNQKMGSNSFILDDISQMIVSIETDQKKENSEASLTTNKSDLVDQMASFIEELKDFIDDRLIDTTSQLEMANKKIGDLYNGINYLTHELVYLKYQNQELKNLVSNQIEAKKNLKKRNIKTQNTNSSLKNLDNELLSIYKKEDSQGSSINFYDNMPSVNEQKSYRTSSQIDFTPIQIVNCVSSDLNHDEDDGDDEEIKSAFQNENEDLDESNIELSSSSNNEEISSVVLDDAGYMRPERDVKNNNHMNLIHHHQQKQLQQQQQQQQRCLIDMKRNDLNNIKFINHHLQTSIKSSFPVNLINDFDAQYLWDYSDQSNMPNINNNNNQHHTINTNSAKLKIKK